MSFIVQQSKSRLAVFTKEKEIQTFDLNCVDDIFNFADQLFNVYLEIAKFIAKRIRIAQARGV